MDWLRNLVPGRKKSVDDDEDSSYDLDLHYISKVHLTTSMPSSTNASSWKTHLNDIMSLLKSRHPNSFMIWNISEQTYDYEKFDHQVLDFGSCSPPSLNRLCEIVQSIHAWLCASSENIAVIHSKGGKGRTGLILSACLFFAGLFDSAELVMKHFASKRTKSGLNGIKQPSEKRYISYFIDIVNSKKPLFDSTANICEIRLGPVPKFTDGLYVEVFDYSDSTPRQIYSSYFAAPSSLKPTEMNEIVISTDIPISNDTLIRCFETREKKMLCYFYFHTSWAPENKQLLFSSKDLDKLDKRMPDDFSVLIRLKEKPIESVKTNQLWELLRSQYLQNQLVKETYKHWLDPIPFPTSQTSDYSRIKELEKSIVGLNGVGLISTTGVVRRLIYESDCLLVSENKADEVKEHRFFLFNDSLLITRGQKSMKLKHRFGISKLRVIDLNYLLAHHSFAVVETEQNLKIIFAAPSAAMKSKWIYEIETQIENSQTNILKRQLLKAQKETLDNSLKQWQEKHQELEKTIESQTQTHQNEQTESQTNTPPERRFRTISDVSDLEFLASRQNTLNKNNPINRAKQIPTQETKTKEDSKKPQLHINAGTERKWKAGLTRFKSADEVVKHYKSNTNDEQETQSTSNSTNEGQNPFGDKTQKKSGTFRQRRYTNREDTSDDPGAFRKWSMTNRDFTNSSDITAFYKYQLNKKPLPTPTPSRKGTTSVVPKPTPPPPTRLEKHLTDATTQTEESNLEIIDHQFDNVGHESMEEINMSISSFSHSTQTDEQNETIESSQDFENNDNNENNETIENFENNETVEHSENIQHEEYENEIENQEKNDEEIDSNIEIINSIDQTETNMNEETTNMNEKETTNIQSEKKERKRGYDRIPMKPKHLETQQSNFEIEKTNHYDKISIQTQTTTNEETNKPKPNYDRIQVQKEHEPKNWQTYHTNTKTQTQIPNESVYQNILEKPQTQTQQNSQTMSNEHLEKIGYGPIPASEHPYTRIPTFQQTQQTQQIQQYQNQVVNNQYEQTSFPGVVPQSNQWRTVTYVPTVAASIVVQIKPTELTFVNNIGSGSFGEVWRGRWRASDVAIKQVRNDSVTDATIQEFWKEVALVSKLRPHANVVAYMGVLTEPLCLVLEFLPGGNMKYYFSKRENLVDNDLLLRWFRGISSGMLHLSLENIVHRDLAARNVLLSIDLTPKISDFGMSRAVDSAESAHQTQSVVGPLKWMPRELLLEQKYSTKSDVWSFGIVCMEMISRNDPFPGMSGAQVSSLVAVGTLRPSVHIPNFVDEKFSRFVDRCFEINPTARPSFQELADFGFSIDRILK